MPPATEDEVRSASPRDYKKTRSPPSTSELRRKKSVKEHEWGDSMGLQRELAAETGGKATEVGQRPVSFAIVLAI